MYLGGCDSHSPTRCGIEWTIDLKINTKFKMFVSGHMYISQDFVVFFINKQFD